MLALFKTVLHSLLQLLLLAQYVVRLGNGCTRKHRSTYLGPAAAECHGPSHAWWFSVEMVKALCSCQGVCYTFVFVANGLVTNIWFYNRN